MQEESESENQEEIQGESDLQEESENQEEGHKNQRETDLQEFESASSSSNRTIIDSGTESSNIDDGNTESNAPGLDTIVEEEDSSISSIDSALLASDEDSESSLIDSALLDSDEESDDSIAPTPEATRRESNNDNDSIDSEDSDAIEAERKALLMKKEQSRDQAKHENALKTVNEDLKEAFARISSGNLRLTIKHLYALLLSKGAAPPENHVKLHSSNFGSNTSLRHSGREQFISPRTTRRDSTK